MAKKHRDIETEVTQTIIDSLAKGVAPWVKPWTGDSAHINPLSGTRYRGINVILLSVAQMKGEYSSSRWMTFRQVRDAATKAMARDLGKETMADAPDDSGFGKQKAIYGAWLRDRIIERGLDPDDYPHIRKGEKGSLVVFTTMKEYPLLDRAGNPVIDEETGEERKKRVFIRKGYTVFNEKQVVGLPEKYQSDDISDEPLFELDSALESALETALPEVKWIVGGTRARYSPVMDQISMPDVQRFETAADWYSTKLHESVHATGHQSRLNRLHMLRKDEEYAREELVAEMGSAFLCAHLGIDGFLQHPEYIGTWLKHLKDDKREVFRAAAKAQKASEFILDGMGLMEESLPTDQESDTA